MGFRFQKRFNLGRGWGLNAGSSGGSLSHRSHLGSVGTKGFSLRTGIPGLTYRRNWGKNAGGAALIVFAVVLVAGAFAIALRILLYVLPLLWRCLTWIGVTLYDLCVHGVGQAKMWRPQSVVTPRNSSGSSHVRDTVIGIAVCGAVYFVFSHWILQAPSVPTPSTTIIAPKETIRKESHSGAPFKSTHRRKINATPAAITGAKKEAGESEAGAVPAPAKPISTTENDDLVDVRTTDAAAATRIETYCVGATAQATSRQAEILARCRHDEAAAWTRLVLQNEFPSITSAIRETCTSPPFPQSFVAEETCVRYETNSDPVH